MRARIPRKVWRILLALVPAACSGTSPGTFAQVAGVLSSGVATALIAAGCEHAQAPAVAPVPIVQAPRVSADLPGVAQYVVAEAAVGINNLSTIPLEHDETGVLLDGRRFVTHAGALRASTDIATTPILAVDRIPAFLGHGFLFRSRTALYASDTFEGPLRPLTSFPAEIYAVSFGPRSALVRCNDGERWMIDVRSGDRQPMAPPAVVDVAALTDGRAVAITEGGGALVSIDHGDRWVDVTSQLSGRAATVFALEGPDAGLWVTQSTSPVLRVEPGGRLARFDAAPRTAAPPRPQDPRWRAAEPPIRHALRYGAALDASTALVVAEGDVMRLDLGTGAIVSVIPGRLPPEADCEAVRTPDDLVFVCTKPSGEHFVVSHVEENKTPVIEQTFAATGRMFASDDGRLAFGGPCTSARASTLVVCVRAHGAWRELDLESAPADGGSPAGTSAMAPFGDGKIIQWVPRGDGGAVGIVGGATPGTIDAATWEAHTWAVEGLPDDIKGPLSQPRRPARRTSQEIVDRSWTATPGGGLRAWLPNGRSLGITTEGAVTVSPFTFDRTELVGAFGMAMTRGERLWQSLDHGATWVEVQAPLSGHTARGIQIRACSAVGCDLGGWYRIGWAATPPVVEPALATVSVPGQVARPPLPELVCKAVSEAHSVSLPRGDRSPEDLGLGAMKLPLSGSDLFMRLLFDRHGTNPVHAANVVPSSDDYAAPRVLLYGSAVNLEANVLALRRQIAFVAPFDSGATVRKASFGVSELVAAGRAVGMQTKDVLGEDPTAIDGVAPVASLDPAGTGDLVFFGGTGAVGVLRANPSARVRQHVAMHAKHGETFEPVSAVATSADEVAILGLDSSGVGHVVKLGPGGVSDVFDAPSPASPLVYPANTDALAIGSRGDLALLRTASGGDPPTASDPALLLVPGRAPLALAPWSTLTSAEDEACKTDAGGFRAIVRTVAPWVRLVGTEPTPDDDAPMMARVRWSTTRVCLEAIELRAADTPVGGDVSLETWMVVHLTAPLSAGKVAVVPGTEVRQAMACVLR